MPEVTPTDVPDEPQHSGAVVAVNYGDYRCQELWVRSGANIGNWYCLGGEAGRPQHTRDPYGHQVPMHPVWADVLARGPVTLLVASDTEARAAGWAAGRRRLLEQMEQVEGDDE